MPDLNTKNNWTIIIDGQGGYCPAYFKNTYPTYGNLNQFSSMDNIDLTDPNVFCQSPIMIAFTNGTQGYAVTTLMKGIMRLVIDNGSTYSTGGAKLYRLTNDTVVSDSFFPHTINDGAVTGEDGEDLVYWRSEVYYIFNYTGGGNIGKLTPSSKTFDDDWGTTIPSGAGALQNAPHQTINGGDDDVYIANGPSIARLYYSSPTTYLDTDALDFWQDSQVASLTWNYNRVIAGVNRPNLAGAYANQSGIYTWNGISSSWEGDPIEVNGRIGALFTKNGVTFCWWQESGQSNVYNFGYITDKLNTIKQFQGTLPLYYQIGEFKGFVSWISDGKTYLWGPSDSEVPLKAFQYCESVHSTSGGIGSPFGELVAASQSGSNYALEKPSTTKYDNDSAFKTIAFNRSSDGKLLSGAGFKSQIDRIQVELDPISEGAFCQPTLTYDKGRSTQTLEVIDAEEGSPTIRNLGHKFPSIDDFRLDFDFSTASPSTPIKFRKIMVGGHIIPNN